MSFVKRTTEEYAVKCDAEWDAGPRGCSGVGRFFALREEAYEWAQAMGWAGEPPSICPAHVEAKFAEREKAEGRKG